MAFTSKQNIQDHVKDQMDQGKITADQANVLAIQMEGVRVITKIPSQIRKALNAAVKNGELKHMKRDGLKPEVYYHINAHAKAIQARNEIVITSIKAISGIATSEDPFLNL